MNFLCEVGLVTNVTQEQFLSFAKSVAELAFLDEEGVDKKSKVLLRHLLQREDLDIEFLSKLKSIAFLNPGIVDENLSNIYPQYGDRNTRNRLHFIAFEGAAIESLSSLVWTVQVFCHIYQCMTKHGNQT